MKMKCKITNRVLSFVLALVMVLSMVPLHARAATTVNWGHYTIEASYICSNNVMCDSRMFSTVYHDLSVKNFSCSENGHEITISFDYTYQHAQNGQPSGMEWEGRYSESFTRECAAGNKPVYGDSLQCDVSWTNEIHVLQNADNTGNEHSGSCSKCGTPVTEPHRFEYQTNGNDTHSGYCTACDATKDLNQSCDHENVAGKMGNCQTKPTCNKCGSLYGSVNRDRHGSGETLDFSHIVWISVGNNQHKRGCKFCRTILFDEVGNCSGGSATCTAKAVCVTCKGDYGEFDSNAHAWSESWSYDGTNHWHACTHNADHKIDLGTHDASNGTDATCTSPAKCGTCGGEFGEPKDHNLIYQLKEIGGKQAIVQGCQNNCQGVALAYLNLWNMDFPYTGQEIKPNNIEYENNWINPELTLEYPSEDYTNVGPAEVLIKETNDKVHFNIVPKTLTVTADAKTVTYGDAAPELTYTITGFVNGETEETAWSKMPDIQMYTVYKQGDNVGKYGILFDNTNITELGNYAFTYMQGEVIVGKAEPTVTAPTAKTGLVYTGQPLALVNPGSTSVGEMQYSLTQNGEYSTTIPTGTAAGDYTVWYKAVVPEVNANYTSSTPAFVEVTIAKQEVTPPTIASKVYNAEHQEADIPISDLYTVTRNDGGTEGGEYPVVLTLKAPANYCWPESYQDKISGENGENLTLTFTITAADNAWETDPNISGWIYGETAATANIGKAQYGTATVKYVGTTNAGASYDSADAPDKAGSYKAVFTVPDTQNYDGLTKEVEFTVARAALPTDVDFSYTEPTLTYNGQEQGVTVTLNTNLTGVEEEHITLNYSDTPKDADDYTFTISIAQSDNYEASAEPLTNDAWTFLINKAQPVISWDINEGFIYNGTPQGEGRAKVTLVNGEVYSGTITYTYRQGDAEPKEGLPTDAGMYNVTAAIAAQGNYKDATDTDTIVINPKEVTPTVVLTPDFYHYDGQAKQLAVKVMDGETEIPDREYDVSYGPTAVGAVNAWIIDTANGNYTIAANTKGVFLILPNIDALEGVTTDNVNSSHQTAIDGIQAAMANKEISEASAEAQKQWNDLLTLCTALEAKISAAKTGSDAIIAGTTVLPQQPKTSELNTIQGLLDKYDAIEDNLTEAEKEALADEIKKLEDLKKAITETNADLKEITDGANALNKDDLDFADKATIADLQKKIDDLESNPYLTDTQKQTLADAEEKLAELEAEFAEADKVTEQLNKLPTTANPDTKTAVEAYEAAKKAYEDLEEDKSKVDPTAVKKLDALKAELTDYKITKGNGAKLVKSSSDGLSFTANGYFGKFTGVKIDGKLIDSENYTAKSGSTIVTLKASYLQKLKTGKHTIAICFGDGDFTGEATGDFRIVTFNGNPFTGDNSNIFLWSGVAMSSLLCLAMMAMFVLRKKGKYER